MAIAYLNLITNIKNNMSHLLETYSLQTGAKISKPFIVKNFYPVPERYITIHNSSGMGGKNYDYFQDVVDEIFEDLEKLNIKIIQIGGIEDTPLERCVHLHGKTSYHQTAYIIQNSLLHIGNDSFPIHLASASNIPLISLYSVTTPEIAGPYFYKENAHCFSPEYKGSKPSFNPNENPKTVNTIKIEKIIEKIYQVLNIDNPKKIETLLIGNKYNEKIIDFVPNTLINQNIISNSRINMRVDLLDNHFDENIIFANLQLGKFQLYLNNKRKINNISGLNILKQNIHSVIFDVSDEPSDLSYIKSLIKSGIKPIIYYTKNNLEYFNNLKIDLLDFNLQFIKHEISKEESDFLKNISNIDNLFLKSNKIILSGGKAYLSEGHLEQNEHSYSKAGQLKNIKNLQSLEKDISYLMIYKIS